MPWSSHTRRRFSRSCRYSLLRARDLLWLSRMRARLAFCYIAARHDVLVKNWMHIAWVCVYVWLHGVGIACGTGGKERRAEQGTAGQGKKHGRESCVRRHLLQVLTFSTNLSPIGSRIEAKDD